LDRLTQFLRDGAVDIYRTSKNAWRDLASLKCKEDQLIQLAALLLSLKEGRAWPRPLLALEKSASLLSALLDPAWHRLTEEAVRGAAANCRKSTEVIALSPLFAGKNQPRAVLVADWIAEALVAPGRYKRLCLFWQASTESSGTLLYDALKRRGRAMSSSRRKTLRQAGKNAGVSLGELDRYFNSLPPPPRRSSFKSIAKVVMWVGRRWTGVKSKF